MNIGELIKTERKKQKLTQKNLAEKLKKSERMIQKYESGEVTPSIEICQQIAKILDINTDKLLMASELENLAVNSFEILFDCVENYFCSVSEFDTYNKMTFRELQELVMNIKSLIDNKIDIVNGLFDTDADTNIDS